MNGSNRQNLNEHVNLSEGFLLNGWSATACLHSLHLNISVVHYTLLSVTRVVAKPGVVTHVEVL